MLTKQSKAGPESLEHEHHDSPQGGKQHALFPMFILSRKAFCSRASAKLMFQRVRNLHIYR